MELNDEYFKRKTAKIISSIGEEGWPFVSNDNPVYLALKEASRDTRHACAEACLSVKYIGEGLDEGIEGQSYDLGFEEAKSMAHSACMGAVK